MSVYLSRFVDVKGQSELFGSNADGKSLFQNLANVGLDVADAQVHVSCLFDREHGVPKGSNLTLFHPKVISESAFTIKSAFDSKSDIGKRF